MTDVPKFQSDHNTFVMSVVAIQNNPPESPVAGDHYIVGAFGSGDWANHKGKITYWSGTAWVMIIPNYSTVVYLESMDLLYRYASATWSEA